MNEYSYILGPMNFYHYFSDVNKLSFHKRDLLSELYEVEISCINKKMHFCKFINKNFQSVISFCSRLIEEITHNDTLELFVAFLKIALFFSKFPFFFFIKMGFDFFAIFRYIQIETQKGDIFLKTSSWIPRIMYIILESYSISRYCWKYDIILKRVVVSLEFVRTSSETTHTDFFPIA